MKTSTSIKAGSLRRNHNEKIARTEKVKNNDRQQSSRNAGYGITVMNIRTGIKAGWISRNYK